MAYRSWDFLNAMNIANASSYVTFDFLEGQEDRLPDSEYVQLITNQSKNPEKEMMKKEEYQNLSDEAKHIISLIINAPSEILEMMTPKTKNLTIRSVSLFISKVFFNRKVPEKKTQKVIKEIESFVRNNFE